MTTHLDHIVVAAKTIEAGVAYVNDKFGVEIPAGGQHEMMGTHNHVMSLGEGVYLEVIAINPEMDSPDSPRWFGLDDPFVRARIDQSPMLLTWALNTDRLESLVFKSLVPLGKIRDAQRDDLRWRVALSADGHLPAAGFIPLCIEWGMDFHPSERMQQLGCSLISLDLYHPASGWLADVLDAIGVQDSPRSFVHIHRLPDKQTAYMSCTVNCSKGKITLSSRCDG